MTLKDVRDSFGYSQEGMARDLGVSLSYYEKIERGIRQPSTNFIRKLKQRAPSIIVDDVFFARNSTNSADT